MCFVFYLSLSVPLLLTHVCETYLPVWSGTFIFFSFFRRLLIIQVQQTNVDTPVDFMCSSYSSVKCCAAYCVVGSFTWWMVWPCCCCCSAEGAIAPFQITQQPFQLSDPTLSPRLHLSFNDPSSPLCSTYGH